jgi:hypothetical protein
VTVILLCLAAGMRLEFLRMHADRWTRLAGWALIGLGSILTLRML